MDWIGNSVVGERVSELTLGEWLATYREVKKLNLGKVNPVHGRAGQAKPAKTGILSRPLSMTSCT